MSRYTKLAIVIINWNKANETLHCVCAISQWSRLKAKLIVVDNGSKRKDLALLQNAECQFDLIINKTNRGYGGGNNAGISKALDLGFDHIMLINSDATIAESCVEQLLECMNLSPSLGVVGPLLEEGGLSYVGGRNIGIYSLTRIPYKPQGSNPKLIFVDYVPGSVLLARREAFEKSGLLDEEFFFSGEIADFCRRVQAAGLACAVYTGCQASHSPMQGVDMRETLYSYYSLRNRFLFVRRHFGYTKLFWSLRWVLEGIEQITISLIKGKRERARAIFLGMQDGIAGRFGDQNAKFIK